MTDPQQQVRAEIDRGAQTVWLDREQWLAFLRSINRRGFDRRVKQVQFLGATVRPHDVISRDGRVL